MQISQLLNRRLFQRVGVLTLVLLGSFSALLARVATEQRDFNGLIKIDVCEKAAGGKWKIIDSVEAPTSFSASVAEVAGGREVNTGFVWNGRSTKGRRISIKLARAGKAAFELTSGRLELTRMPFEVSIDGKKELVTYNLTTESAEGPDGPINGRRAMISNRQAKLAMVGSTVFRPRQPLIDELAEKKGGLANINRKNEFLVVIRAEGSVVAR